MVNSVSCGLISTSCAPSLFLIAEAFRSVLHCLIKKSNVFKDIGFTDEEAIALAMRVDVAVEIEKFIKRKKLTQMKAAAYFEVPQPKLSGWNRKRRTVRLPAIASMSGG